jgi:hypothetical protein
MKPRLNVVWNEIYCKRCLILKAIQVGYDLNVYED